MVYGWGSVCKVRQGDQFIQYRDTDDEEFPEDVTEAGWRDFMRGERVLDAMHDGNPVGRVLYAFPMIEEVAKAFGLADALEQTGVIVGAEIDDPAIAAGFESGEITGFSIDGMANYQEIDE